MSSARGKCYKVYWFAVHRNRAGHGGSNRAGRQTKGADTRGRMGLKLATRAGKQGSASTMHRMTRAVAYVCAEPDANRSVRIISTRGLSFKIGQGIGLSDQAAFVGAGCRSVHKVDSGRTKGRPRPTKAVKRRRWVRQCVRRRAAASTRSALTCRAAHAGALPPSLPRPPPAATGRLLGWCGDAERLRRVRADSACVLPGPPPHAGGCGARTAEQVRCPQRAALRFHANRCRTFFTTVRKRCRRSYS